MPNDTPITMTATRDLFVLAQSHLSTAKTPVYDLFYCGPVNCIVSRSNGTFYGHFSDGRLDFAERVTDHSFINILDEDVELRAVR